MVSKTTKLLTYLCCSMLVMNTICGVAPGCVENGVNRYGQTNVKTITEVNNGYSVGGNGGFTVGGNGGYSIGGNSGYSVGTTGGYSVGGNIGLPQAPTFKMPDMPSLPKFPTLNIERPAAP